MLRLHWRGYGSYGIPFPQCITFIDNVKYGLMGDSEQGPPGIFRGLDRLGPRCLPQYLNLNFKVAKLARVRVRVGLSRVDSRAE